MDTDVLVVGAGPTGLTAACGLAAAGVSVRVVDAAPGPATTSRALALQPRGVEVLDRLNALGDLPDRALPIGRLVLFVDGRKLASLRIDQALRPGDPGVLLMSQADIEGALRHRLIALGGSIEWGRAVTDVDAETDGVRARFVDGSAIRAGWVVGADGAHSAVRKAAGINFSGVRLVERFLLADVHADTGRPRDATAAWLRGTRMLVAMPLPGKDLWRLMAPAPAHGPADPRPDEVVAHLADLLAAETGGTVRTAEWTSTFGIQRRLADTYRRRRVLLAGDAAHIHSPFGGQGMNTGLGDAENLAWKLALVIGGRADADLLDTYEAERRPIARDVLASTSSVTVGALGQGFAARMVRDRVAVPLLNQDWLQRLIVGKASQLQVSYRRGPLGARRWPPLGLRPGDRVPNRDCVRGDGTPVRLHDALGPDWALLGAQPLAEVAREGLGEVAWLRGDDGPALLIRPDAHLAWRGNDPRALQAWLDEVMGRHPRVLAR